MNFDRLGGKLALVIVVGLGLPQSAQAADIEAGRTVYATNCAFCHGSDGSPLKKNFPCALARCSNQCGKRWP